MDYMGAVVHVQKITIVHNGKNHKEKKGVPAGFGQEFWKYFKKNREIVFTFLYFS